MLQNDRYKKFCNRRKTEFCGMVFVTAGSLASHYAVLLTGYINQLAIG